MASVKFETLLEYSFVDSDGTIWNPIFNENSRKWGFISRNERIISYLSLGQIIRFCKIPEDDAIILRLKYGSN